MLVPCQRRTTTLLPLFPYLWVSGFKVSTVTLSGVTSFWICVTFVADWKTPETQSFLRMPPRALPSSRLLAESSWRACVQSPAVNRTISNNTSKKKWGEGVLTHGLLFGVQLGAGLLQPADLPLQPPDPQAGGGQVALQLLEYGAGVFGQVRQLPQGPG